MRDPTAQGGFTLVEMLVSLALLAVAAGLMVQGFSASRDAWRRMQAREETGETVSSAEGRLRSTLEQMVMRARFDASPPYLDLQGEDARVTFASAPLAGEPPGPAVARELSLSPRGELGLAHAGTDDAPAAPSDVLLKGVSSLELAYYGQAAGETQAAWRPDWSRQRQPPELIRVRVGFPPGDRRIWPELIVRPAAMVDVQCVIDGDTGRCRGRA